MTAVNSAPLSPVAPPPLAASKMDLRDFPDRLSPMVVKELRQGLRSPMFVWAFIIVHLVLVMVVLAGLDNTSRGETTMFFWWSFILPVVLLMPMRGINSLTDEIRMKTMDTLLLTRLSALRICLGKWIAIVAQLWLVGLTVLPYLIMRYFSGGLDLWNEVKWLFHFLVMGTCFAAATVGFSWQKHFLFRGITTLGIGIALGIFCAFITSELIAREGFDAASFKRVEGMVTFFFYLLASYLSFYFLDYAAAQIAPLAENRSTLRRILTLLLMALLCALAYWKEELSVVSLMALTILLALAGGDAATERTKQVSIIVQPFVKRGFLGRLVGRVLYPGWHSGFLFLHLLAGLTILGYVCRAHHYGYSYSLIDRSFALFCLVVYGQVALGLVIQRRFFARAKSPLAVFIIIEGAIFLLHMLVLLLANVGNVDGMHFLMIWSPYDVYLLGGAYDYPRTRSHLDSGWLTYTAVLGGFYATIMFYFCFKEFRITRHVEAQCEADLAEEAEAEAKAKALIAA
jgi:hypothetical protein